MKKQIPCTLALAALSLSSLNAATTIAAAWDFSGAVNTPQIFTTGVTGSVTLDASGTFRADRGSTDGTFGSAWTGANISETNDAVIRVRDTTGLITISLTNNTGSTLTLNGFHFDYGGTGATGFAGYTAMDLKYNGTLITRYTGISADGSTIANISNYLDFDATGLAFTLANGATGSFTLSGFTMGTGTTTGDQNFDNFAITAVPEPGAALLGGLGLLALLRRRR